METEILTLTGHVEIELPEEDPVVFTILLNIIHGRDRRVPRRIQPKLLVMLAMAVDKYQLGEAVRIHSHVWMDEMMRHIPDYYDHDSHDLLYWISISWIFRHAKAFDKAAKVLIHRATGPLNRELFEDMPMPQWVIGKSALKKSLCRPSVKLANILLDNIELDRICLLETLFDELAFWVENFQTWAQSCQHYSHGIWDSCEKVVLHSYRSSCRARKIFPVPDAPYTGHSVGSLLEDVRTLQVKTLCSRITPSGMQGDTGGHGFIDEVYDGCTWIVETAEILEMKDLENPKKYSRLTAIDYDFQELEISGSDSKGTC